MDADSALNFLKEAGPTAITPLVPHEVVLELGQDGPFREMMKLTSQAQQIRIYAHIDAISYENAHTDWKAFKGGYPWARFPPELVKQYELLYGEGSWPDDKFIEDCLKHHPGLRCNVKRNEKGNEWRK